MNCYNGFIRSGWGIYLVPPLLLSSKNSIFHYEGARPKKVINIYAFETITFVVKEKYLEKYLMVLTDTLEKFSQNILHILFKSKYSKQFSF